MAFTVIHSQPLWFCKYNNPNRILSSQVTTQVTTFFEWIWKSVKFAIIHTALLFSVLPWWYIQIHSYSFRNSGSGGTTEKTTAVRRNPDCCFAIFPLQYIHYSFFGKCLWVRRQKSLPAWGDSSGWEGFLKKMLIDCLCNATERSGGQAGNRSFLCRFVRHSALCCGCTPVGSRTPINGTGIRHSIHWTTGALALQIPSRGVDFPIGCKITLFPHIYNGWRR